jgi:hypothetical protein
VTALEFAALVSMGWACLAMTAAIVRARRRGTSRVVAAPSGPAWPGIAYAFGQGMSPGAKESAWQHPVVYAAGLVYHAGIAAAAGTLVVTLAHHRLPSPVGHATAFVLFAAVLAGAGLFARRLRSTLLRTISAADDYAANVLVDAWLATAALSLLLPETVPVFLAGTTVVGVYAPLGKIRHCVFFFLARGQFGARLGRHGIVRSRRTEVGA